VRFGPLVEYPPNLGGDPHESSVKKKRGRKRTTLIEPNTQPRLRSCKRRHAAKEKDNQKGGRSSDKLQQGKNEGVVRLRLRVQSPSRIKGGEGL